MTFARVAVPVPLLNLLTYRVPEGMAVPVAGARVVAPLGSRLITGIVIETLAGAPSGGLQVDGVAAADIKPIHQVLDADPIVPPDILDLARWTADYYAAGAGETITAVLPPMARGARAHAHKVVRVASITIAGLQALSTSPEAHELARTAKQREALAFLASNPGGAVLPDLASRGVAPGVVGRLAQRGLVSLRPQAVERDPFRVSDIASDSAGRPLTPEQADAFRRLLALLEERRFRVALVHGVTGSGKTELYLQLTAATLQTSRRALMLVPEIGLTPAVTAMFRGRFGNRVAIQHSGLSNGERYDQWQRIRGGNVDVVVGTRSAVFAPLDRLGLIVVDEEHDGSYKQEESPRYHGRDVAIVRGQQSSALVLLGSATPSMESYYNATTGKYERVVLERRVLDRPLASVQVVDMRQEYAAAGPDVVLSRQLADAIQARLLRREQSLLLLNRRGFATAVFCRQCAATLDCPNCSVSLVIHGQASARRARCHYCNYSSFVPATCRVCAAPYLEQTGFGTERVEADVRRCCPDARVARLDRDTVRRRGALGALLARFREGTLDVLVGTQMIAKGHDFPRVTLVGVVSADVGLGMADFRASERTFQLLTQVAGRAGRGEQPGEAIIQTLYPDHYSIQLACRQDYPEFFDRELRFRRAMRYPPLVSLVNAMVRGRTFATAMNGAAEIADGLRRLAGTSEGFRVLGPAPASLARLRGEYRAQVLIKGGGRKRLREALQAVLGERPELARRTTIDVDPLNVQ